MHHHSERTEVRLKPRFPRLALLRKRAKATEFLDSESMGWDEDDDNAPSR